MIGEDKEGEEGQENQPDPQMEQMHQEMQQQMQELQGQAQQLSQENQMLKVKDANKAQELDIKIRELQLKEQEAIKQAQIELNTPPTDEVALAAIEAQKERDKMAHDSMEADKDRQVELAKAIIAKSEGEGVEMDGAMDEAAQMMQQITAALTAPRAVIRDEAGNIIGSETVING